MEQAYMVPDAQGVARETCWVVDEAAAGRVAAWARGPGAALLAQEIAEMATYFPRWGLTLGDGQRRTPRAPCGELLVFREGRARCVGCGRPARPRQAQLAWTGHLPLPVDGLPRALKRIRRAAHPVYPLVVVGGQHLWLVPVLAFYPANW